MFYHLLFPLRNYFSGFNVLQYITFRSAGAAVTALLITFMVGPFFIRLLKRHQIGEELRSDGPESHLAKRGTPTMGGIIIITAIICNGFPICPGIPIRRCKNAPTTGCTRSKVSRSRL